MREAAASRHGETARTSARSRLAPWALLVGLLHCACGPARREPPVPEDLGALDPAVRELIDGRVSEVRARPGETEPWLRLGMAYEANALADLAVPCYREVLAAGPEHAKAWYRLGLALSSLGRLEEAREAWTRAAELAPERAFTQWRLGLALLDAGELPRARAAFESALRLDPASIPARFGLARVLLQEDDAQAALELLDALVEEEPEEPRLRQLREAARRRLGLGSSASPTAAATPATWSDAWAAEAASSWVGFGADLARADQALSEGHPAEAARLLAPHRSARSDDAVFLTTLGAALVRSGRTEEGLAALVQAEALEPSRAAATLELAQAFHRSGRLDEAMAAADRACRLEPDSARAHETRGLVLRLRGRQEAALEAFARASRLDPQRSSARRYLGSLQFETARFDDALATYSAAVELSPGDEKGWLGLGMAQLELGRFPEAERALRRAERLGPPGRWQVHLVLAELERRRVAAGAP